MAHALLTALSILSLAALSTAQGVGDFDLDKTSPGTLGSNLTFDFDGAGANRILLAMYSLNRGPTPLSAVDPGDSRVLAVGTDEINGWFTLPTGATGAGTFSLAVPNLAALQGLEIHAQALTAPGAGRVVDEISNAVMLQLGAAPGSSFLSATLGTGRAVGTVCVDRDNDAGAGDVILAGGGAGTLFSATGLSSSEKLGFRDLRAGPGPVMTAARALAESVELADGRTLIVGGVDAMGAALATCEIYDPATNSFVATGSMAAPRVASGITLLADGRVLVAGGTTDLSDATAAVTNVTSSAELFDPATGRWTSAAAIGGRRLAPALATLANGRVLLSGGVSVGFFFGIPISATSTSSCSFYDPGTNSWSPAPAMGSGHAYHQGGQAVLNDGRVLVTGGVFVPNLLGAATAGPTAAAEVFDPVTNAWTSAAMAQARGLHTATLLTDGRVLVAAGAQGTLQNPISIASTELFDPSTNSFSAGPMLRIPRAGHAAVRLPDGLVVILGGQDLTTTADTLEALHF